MIEITSGKQPLRLANPVIGASGIFGYAGEYAKLIDLSKLGAIVTNAVTLRPRRAATGTRVVPLDSGVLVHTGLPNLGIHQIHRLYATKWKNGPLPFIVHVAATTPEEVGKCVQILDTTEGIVAIEIGLSDQSTHRDAKLMIGAARQNTQLPLLAKLPMFNVTNVSVAAEEAGADALVVAAPPRGTARDPLSGQLVGGRLYGPWLKALGLRAVGAIARHVKIPVIGCGGIHNPDDARDYLEAGAVAVMVDSVAWIRPDMVEIIARNLGGLELTRAIGAMEDEWRPGIGETAVMRAQLLASPPPVVPPPHLPE
ncbi:MAG: HisA/HisF-related TIM barrel protein [Chloroflexota bacterium]